MSNPPRFFAETSPADDGTIHLCHTEARHALKVLRLRRGQRIEIFDGRGLVFLSEIESLSNAGLTARVIGQRRETPAIGPAISVGIGIAKGKHFETALRLASELGARTVFPLLTARTIVRSPAGDTKKLDRWRKIAVESSKQSRQARLTSVEEPIPFREMISLAASFDLSLIATLENETVPLVKALGSRPAPSTILALIGPEGDFTPQEAELARLGHAIPVRLTRSVLRVETAVAYIVSALLHHCSSPDDS